MVQVEMEQQKQQQVNLSLLRGAHGALRRTTSCVGYHAVAHALRCYENTPSFSWGSVRGGIRSPSQPARVEMGGLCALGLIGLTAAC